MRLAPPRLTYIITIINLPSRSTAGVAGVTDALHKPLTNLPLQYFIKRYKHVSYSKITVRLREHVHDTQTHVHVTNEHKCEDSSMEGEGELIKLTLRTSVTKFEILPLGASRHCLCGVAYVS
ncbi:hypothetical protein V1477_011317 [Vespula maculifrons]|uniref:Uncharacterized protein n=1 Tax=Vespula maculifrons TaxID=7453 RepID=A0ABD2C4G1_VESMC